jgi:hypothetical protein
MLCCKRRLPGLNDSAILDADILHRGLAFINGDHSTAMPPVVQWHVFWVELIQADVMVCRHKVQLPLT